MKNLFAIILLSLTLFSCSTIDPIVEDVCSITQDICYYANLICDNYEPGNISKTQAQEILSALQIVNAELQLEEFKLNRLKLQQTTIANPNTKSVLINARTNLIKIYSEQQKLLAK